MNSRAGLNPTYTLSRGASSANLSTSPNTGFFLSPVYPASAVCKTRLIIIAQHLLFVKPFFKKVASFRRVRLSSCSSLLKSLDIFQNRLDISLHARYTVTVTIEQLFKYEQNRRSK